MWPLFVNNNNNPNYPPLILVCNSRVLTCNNAMTVLLHTFHSQKVVFQVQVCRSFLHHVPV